MFITVLELFLIITKGMSDVLFSHHLSVGVFPLYFCYIVIFLCIYMYNNASNYIGMQHYSPKNVELNPLSRVLNKQIGFEKKNSVQQ